MLDKVLSKAGTEVSERTVQCNFNIYKPKSLMEGFSLPPAEAMMCGCAVVVTDIGGHREYCKHNITALLSKPKDISKMVENVLVLINNNKMGIDIAYKVIRKYLNLNGNIQSTNLRIFCYC